MGIFDNMASVAKNVGNRVFAFELNEFLLLLFWAGVEAYFVIGPTPFLACEGVSL
jgi:hypothetical protein